MKNPIDFEQEIISHLFSNPEFNEAVWPFLRSEVFDSDVKVEKLYNGLVNFVEKYERFPSSEEFDIYASKYDYYEMWSKIRQIDTSNRETDFIFSEIENFIKQKLLFLINIEINKTLNEDIIIDDKILLLQDKLTEIQHFSFTKSLGLDLWDDPEEVYNSFLCEENCLSTGLNSLDQIMKGGYSEKSLTLYVAGCVDPKTLVKIRYNNNYKTIEIGKIEELINKGFEVEVLSPEGYSKIEAVVTKFDLPCRKIKTTNKEQIVANNHLFFTTNGWKKTEDIKIGDSILAENNKIEIVISNESEKSRDVIDLQVDNKYSWYYTDGLISHNTNVGKSWILCNSAASLIMNGKNVLYISLEEPEERIRQRVFQNILDLTSDEIRLKKTFMERYEKAKNKAITNTNYSLKILGPGDAPYKASEILPVLRNLKEKEKFVPDIIFIDYLSCMRPSKKTFNSDKDYSAIKAVIEEIKSLNGKFDMPIVSAAQLNRAGAKSQNPELSDIGDAFALAQKADACWVLYRDEALTLANKMRFTFAKSRVGNKDKQVEVLAYSEKQRFEDEANYKITQRQPAIIVDKFSQKNNTTQNNQNNSNVLFNMGLPGLGKSSSTTQSTTTNWI